MNYHRSSIAFGFGASFGNLLFRICLKLAGWAFIGFVLLVLIGLGATKPSRPTNRCDAYDPQQHSEACDVYRKVQP